MTGFLDNGKRFRLTDPMLAPVASGYLWNRRMMMQVNCQGYAVSQYMDPEPRKYAHVPTVAGQTFMQPEQGFFAHHPGRFFYVRDNGKSKEQDALFSAPFAPVCKPLDRFEFEQGLSDIRWSVERDGLIVDITLSLTDRDILELWQVTMRNASGRTRSVSLVPYFPVGYASWMNLGGHFDPELNAAVATSITPYQKVEQYFKNRHLKDMTFLAASRVPDAFELSQPAFEGSGGLHNPSALQNGGTLRNGDALYEVPACIMQWNLTLDPDGTETFGFIFGPAKDKTEIAHLRKTYLDGGLQEAQNAYHGYVSQGQTAFELHSPDEEFNHFVNHWLPRQIFYHGDCHRLTTDPQTRNYLQDSMGMLFIDPARTKEAILRTVSQQHASGQVPDGILLTDDAELKYINQIPHTDHAVWLVLVLRAYLDETADRSILEMAVSWIDDPQQASLFEHVSRALGFLLANLDDRGLPFIAQGDWCDPMNMVGYKGRGVSGWLAQAMAHALALWADVCGQEGDHQQADHFASEAARMNDRINAHLWDKDWYGRGITDDGVVFGIATDDEGRIFLNSQSWALLSGAADETRTETMLKAIERELMTPFGVMMCGPAFTHMREDVGRVTQKWPGSAENGSVYNHAAIFYAASLFHIGQADRAFEVMRKMLTGANTKDMAVRRQLPVFIPNYYRGAYHQFPRAAGRSSNLFNTGTVAWFYRLVQEQMCGIRGAGDEVIIDPQFPDAWQSCRFTRPFRGALFEGEYLRGDGSTPRSIEVDGTPLKGSRFKLDKASAEKGRIYKLVIRG